MTIKQANSILEDIAGEIGFGATNALVDWFGGSNLYVPENATENHPICHVIGMSCFARLIRMYGGESVTIPMDMQRDRARTNRLIAALLERGLGTKQIAKIAFMTERQVHYVRVELEQAGLIPMVMHPGAGTILVHDDITEAELRRK